MHTVEIGQPYPLGATVDETGTNFALAVSREVEAVELCLVADDGTETRIPLEERHGTTWHAHVAGIGHGQRYGYRVHGPWDPARGLWHNPAKILVDPYARAFTGDYEWGQQHHSYDFDEPDRIDTSDNLGTSMLGVVVAEDFDWGDDAPPAVELTDTVIYETHVKGMTKLHPAVPEELRGTYAGMAHPEVVRHLTELGVTAVELMPVHQFVNDATLQEKGLSNYWGYNTLGFFAPHAAYASSSEVGGQVREFKQMVKDLHAAGLEVILDVVYNHTAEGNDKGPMLSLRGLDNAGYYHLVEGDERHYMDYTGTGNSVDLSSPKALQLVMDSLRYWVTEMHVDGFRFDLATTLTRVEGEQGPDMFSGFFDVVRQDPVLRTVKLIAEPWDVGWGGYQVGNFPGLWSEWNGMYRDAVRDFWRGEPGTLGEFATRLTGSADLYEGDGRGPGASVNFVTAHDGFTLRDLVSYNEKHNEANGEDNNDGEAHNRSWNCGVEGETDDPEVVTLRARQRRNFLATLLISQGVPMISHGDELGRTQGGNNNVYCQDNEISWIDWSAMDDSLVAFTRDLIALRRDHAVFRRRHHFDGRPAARDIEAPLPDIVWLEPDATAKTEDDWGAEARSIGFYLNGHTLPRGDEEGEEPYRDFYVLMNAWWEPVPYTLPGPTFPAEWEVVVDTSSHVAPSGSHPRVRAGDVLELPARSTVVLRQVPEGA
ncbi:glycogen debranching enzyme GlgX [Micrococcus sp. HSID17228]|uniref:glycogen debranching protein GlgX n=1 Tax=Micrococcus TaxID=1269 RepID=UPI00076A9DE0|nr:MULTISPECIES: glycogen debranching protein GlgX [Micrococcus]MCD0183747.1 glycogen debranching protein GlgX [Micrococcus luteus]MCT2067780.1 glycogen debranching protein GlgX [Micrococcus luteus]MCV7488824.1 glycogen debranching protein GlgX [Micrococcus luteus]NNM37831.1 glycogen debranching protein GlgX [Micrococcus luteus]RUQ42637.1 glycogen debranching enzyme GlgX [Micrococcus sp. HSID17227]